MDNHASPRKSLFEIYLPAPNPIIDTSKIPPRLSKEDQLNWKFVLNEIQSKPFNRIVNEESSDFLSDEDGPDREKGRNMWDYMEENRKNMVYQKFNNYPWTMIPLNNQRFCSSVFFDVRKLIALRPPTLNTQNDLIAILGKYFTSQKQKIPEVPLLDAKSLKGLKFNSMFESGNLFAAFKVSDREYDLLLQNDYNSKGNTQWFYFSVENTIKGQSVKFNIINFLKNDSLFNYGQRPVYFSTKKHGKLKNSSWQKCGKQINYYKNKIKRENSKVRTYYTLSFVHKFDQNNDLVYFAQCYPYTYSDVMDLITAYMQDPIKKKLFHQLELCKTIGRLTCPLLIITSPTSNYKEVSPILLSIKENECCCNGKIASRRNAWFNNDGRSFRFFVRKFLGSRNTQIFFYILYGVLHGNYRCNLNGIDLNRVWNFPHRDFHDTVYQTKEFIRDLGKNGDLKLVIDLHGHSKKFNSFFYGNPSSNPLKTRLLPLIASRINEAISINDCTFTINESKKNTARIALQEDQQGLCYTFETSFHGYQRQGNNEPMPFNFESYKQLGKDIILSFEKMVKASLISEMPVNHFKGKQMLSSEKEKELDLFMSQINENLDQILNVGNKDSSGSESNPEADNLHDNEVVSFQKPSDSSAQNQKTCYTPQRSYRKRLKCDKYTQTDSNQFQNIMLDPQVLAIVEQQLAELKGQSERRPSTMEYQSDQSTMKYKRKHRPYVEELNSDIPHNSLSISGYQYQNTRKKIENTQYIYNFSRNQQQPQQTINIQQFEQECQTAISLQQILGKVQIFQIKINQNQFFQKNYGPNQNGSKQSKPLIILLQTPGTQIQQQQTFDYQGHNRQVSQSSLQITQGTQQTKQQIEREIKYQNQKSQIELNGSQVAEVSRIPSKENSSNIYKIIKLNEISISKNIYREEQCYEQEELNMSKSRQNMIQFQKRWNSVHQSPAKNTLISSKRHESAYNGDQQPASPPSFIVINEKKLTQNIRSKNKFSMIKQPLTAKQTTIQNLRPAFKTKMVNVSLQKK